MPRVAYSQGDREKIRQALIAAALALMARQGIQHTTVEQIYRAVGISRSFFYTFFPTKEDLVVEAFYQQQPQVLERLEALLADPALTWREGAEEFFRQCCQGEQSGLAVMSAEEQQLLFRRLSPESFQLFRQRQGQLFAALLETLGVRPSRERVQLFTNLCLSILVIRRSVPQALPFLVPEAADATARCQIRALVDVLASKAAEDAAAGG